MSIIVGLVAVLPAVAQDMAPSAFDYSARYHFGLIDVEIGHGTVTVEKYGSAFSATMNGHSIPWGGRILCVSDTLRANLTPGSETVEYINGWYMKPETSDFKNMDFASVSPDEYKNIHGAGGLDASSNTMEAIGIMANMTALYFYFRVIDFASMADGESVSIPIASSGGVDKVTLIYNGTSDFSGNGIERSVFNISFEYSIDGAPTGYTVDSRVDIDSRIPITFSAHLPIGFVEMTLKP